MHVGVAEEGATHLEDGALAVAAMTLAMVAMPLKTKTPTMMLAIPAVNEDIIQEIVDTMKRIKVEVQTVARSSVTSKNEK